MRRLRHLAWTTPASRERYIDLLRAVAIIAVIVGHWLMTVIQPEPTGQLAGHNALEDLIGARVVTWVFQVLPLFFLVGGYANAASLTNRLARDGDRAGWLADRSARLLGPTTLFLLIAAAVALVAWLAGVDPRQIRLAIWFVTVPLWFLAPYLVMVLLTPVMYALHERAGLTVPAVLLGLVGLGDAARLAGLHLWGAGNYLFGWMLLHQLGFAWRTGSLRLRPRAATALLLGGLAVLVLLTVPGPYPIGMINLPGQRLQNMSPPTLALISLAAAQLGLVLLLRERAERMLRRTGPWTVVVAINAVVLTVFLWHLTAVTLLAGALDALGILPTPPAGSTAWWLLRAPWVIMAGVMLTPLVLLFGPVETRAARRPRSRRTPPVIRRLPAPGSVLGRLPHPVRAAVTVFGYLAVVGGLLGNSNYPRDAVAPLGIPLGALAAYLAGAALLRLLRVASTSASPSGVRQ